jgi:hypothetical protein
LNKLYFLPLVFSGLVACSGGGGSDDDSSPDSFSFEDESGVALDEYVISEPVEVSGINTETTISITGGEYSINGGAFTEEEGELVDGDNVYVRVLSAETLNTETEATVTIGDEEDTFTVETVSIALRARAGVKSLTFTWPTVEGAELYRLLVKPDADSEFEQYGRDLDAAATGIDIEMPIHLTDWHNIEYKLEACTNAQCSETDAISVFSYMLRSIAYFKSSNPEELDRFGPLALSADGHTLAIGAPGEDGASLGINGDEGSNARSGAGAVYVFVKDDDQWRYHAYIKASNTGEADAFGSSLALSGDGNTLAVGAPYEDSSATGVDANQHDDGLENSGAVYTFKRNGDVWLQQNYIKSNQPGQNEHFGSKIAISSGGSTLAITAPGEDSSGSLVNPVRDELATDSGAVEMFEQLGDNWQFSALIKAHSVAAGESFGNSVALSANGNRLVVGAAEESSAGTGIDPADLSRNLNHSGAAYLFERSGGNWSFAHHFKSSNPASDQLFGSSVSISGDGSTIAVGAPGEASIAIGIDGDQSDRSNPESGAAYIFYENVDDWQQSAYVKSSNGDIADLFGSSVSLNANGDVLAVGAPGESSDDEGVSASQSSNDATDAGAAYSFHLEDQNWAQIKYIKAPNTDPGDHFGRYLALDASGKTLAIAAPDEQSSSALFGNTQSSNAEDKSGAAYLY